MGRDKHNNLAGCQYAGNKDGGTYAKLLMLRPGRYHILDASPRVHGCAVKKALLMPLNTVWSVQVPRNTALLLQHYYLTQKEDELLLPMLLSWLLGVLLGPRNLAIVAMAPLWYFCIGFGICLTSTGHV